MLEASKNYVGRLVEENLRIDERKSDELRSIKVETGIITTAEGSARVTWGNTIVLAGVKMSVGEPFPDTPDEGVLIVNSELVPVASPTFEPGPPSEQSIELARVIDRGIRESHAIDLEKLMVEKGKVWNVNIDVYVLDHDGNFIDAGALAAIAAVMDAKLPEYKNEKINYAKLTTPLPVKDMPIAVTIAKIGNKILVDPQIEEENAMDARITITTTREGDICSIQKGGEGFFTTNELEKAADLSIAKGKEIRTLLK